MHELKLAASVFGVIFVAELPDKTALAALVLATRYAPLPVFLGATLALAVQSMVAVVAGSFVGMLPARGVHLGAGVVFIVSALVMWVRKEDAGAPLDRAVESPGAPKEPSFFKAAATVFAVVFIAEWGDLTQFATAAFAAHERAPWVVFAASTLALCAVAGIAVRVGHHAGKTLDQRVTQKIAAALFVAVGVALIAGWI